MSNWLITGGCGFIGSSLIQKLIRLDPEVNIRVLDNLSVGTKEDLLEVCRFHIISQQNITSEPLGVELLIGDIRDEQTCLTAAIGVDVIVHLAANTGVGPSVENPRLDCITNVIGVFNMLEAARHKKVKRFVFASSGAPIGECKPPIHEELAPHPVSPYGASKLAGEGYCSSYFKSFGIDTVALRFGNVYGPGSKRKSSVIAKFIQQALIGETLEIYGDGLQTRDFVYIEDLLNAIMLASDTQNIGGEVFQIANNQETTVSEITSKLVKTLQDCGQNNINVINTGTRLGDVKRNYSDTRKAKTILNWKPNISQGEGIKRTVEYFVKLNNLK